MSNKNKMTPLKAIRAYCKQCAGRPKEVRLCQVEECPLFEYKMGKNFARKGVGPGRVIKKTISNDKKNDSAKDFMHKNDYEGRHMAYTTLPVRGAIKEQLPIGSIRVIKKGKIDIEEVGDGVVIKITNDKTGE
ncbi:MAG: hypothetical protein P9L88_04660 [Candidatus Tantalella remota]|nr:hypothetical protein [Candidatus Tantalella remota]